MTKYYSAQSGRVYRLTSCNELSHHGILGQKWGVRRFQNADRTWTEAGKIRYGSKGDGKSKGRLNGTGKAPTDYTNIDHQKKGNKSAALTTALSTALSAAALATGNPLGLIGVAEGVGRTGMAVGAKIKEAQAEKRLSKLETDEKSGLKLKDHETTPEEDMKLTNPGYHNFNTNTKNNCALCSTTFELRRRGYDCIAEKAGVGYQPEEMAKWFKGAKSTFYTDENPDSQAAYRPTKERSQALTKYVQDNIASQGDGARGYLNAYFGATAGHAMAYEVKNGNVVIYDAQCGKKYPVEKITNMAVDIGYIRVDDKEPNWAAMKAAGVI